MKKLVALVFLVISESGKAVRRFRGNSRVVQNNFNGGIKAHSAGHFLNERHKERSKLFSLDSII